MFDKTVVTNIIIMNRLFQIILILFLSILSGCYLQKSVIETSYKWETKIEYYEKGQVKQKIKSKNLRRYESGTAANRANIRIIREYDEKGKKTSKTIILTESGGCYKFTIKEDTIKCRFPKLYLRKIKYMIGF